MKKVLTFLVVLASVLAIFGIKTNAAGTGDLVIHFKAWDTAYDYSAMGSHFWGTGSVGSPKLNDGVDSFGAYWNYPGQPVGAEVNFIAVEWANGSQDWNKKFTQDVKFGTNIVVEGKTVHLYVFQGAATTADDPGFFAADPDRYNVLAVYYDPSNSYSDALGIHGWGWVGDAGSSSWGTPTLVLENAGVSQSGYPVKGFLLSAVETWAGFLMYAGTNADKKTGDLKPDTGWFTNQVIGTTEVVYIVNGGDGLTDNSNVFTDYAAFASEAFSFRLKPFVADDMSGTFAQNPTDIYVSLSAPVASPYPTAVDKDAARADIESWFTVKEVTGVGTYGSALTIDHVDFALSATTLNTFVIVLDSASKLDNSKEYQVFFNTNKPQDLAVAKDVQVTINLTVPASTPAEELDNIFAAGSFNNWTPGTANYSATLNGTTLSLTFTVSVTSAYTTFEYKWTRGAWSSEEKVSSNRTLVISSDDTAVTVSDTVTAWNDLEPNGTVATPEDRSVLVIQHLEADLAIAMDTSAPTLTFISPSTILGKVAAERIIVVQWGVAFDQNLFPGYRVDDDRDGDLTNQVYVPAGAFSTIDTSTEGDYTIMLQVEDKWGNITQETFIFRVTK